MAPAHPAQHPVVERLHTHTYAVRPQVPEGTRKVRPPAGNIVRIDLDGKLPELVVLCVKGFQQAFKERERHHRRRASPYVECIDG